MGRMMEAKKALIEPLPPGMKELIDKGRAIVKVNDRHRWRLLELVAEVETKYGDRLIERFAYEIGISPRSAWEYRRLAHKGVDAAFIGKWMDKLTYTVIREVMQRHSNVAAAEHRLQEIYEKKLRQDEIIAQSQYVSTISEQERKEFEDHLKQWIGPKSVEEEWGEDKIERVQKLVQSVPELAKEIQGTVLTSEEALEELEARGRAISETKAVKEADRLIKKLKSDYQKYMMQKKHLEESIVMNHELSEELQFRMHKLAKILAEISSVMPIAPELMFSDDDVVEVD